MRAAHQELLDQYVEALRSAKLAAEQWWEELVASEARTGEDREGALRKVRQRWPYGPVAHPRVLAVIRQYYFACQALNGQLAETEEPAEEYPHIFVTEMLMEDRTADLGDFVDQLPSLPIGVDEDGDPV